MFRVSFNFTHDLNEEFDDEGLLTRIEASIECLDDEDDDEPEVVGHLCAVLINVTRACNEGLGIWEACDADSEDLVDAFGAVWDPEKDNYIAGALDGFGDALYIDQLHIVEKFRGQGLGLLVVQRLLDAFSGVVVALVHPVPADKSPDDPLFKEAQLKLQRYWERLDFCAVGQTGVFMQDTAQKRPTFRELQAQEEQRTRAKNLHGEPRRSDEPKVEIALPEDGN